jgi:hypothetical protein
LNAAVTQTSQSVRIALPRQNRADNGLSGDPAEITDGNVQLHVHLDQGLLHVLDLPPRLFDILIAQPPHRTHLVDLRGGKKQARSKP